MAVPNIDMIIEVCRKCRHHRPQYMRFVEKILRTNDEFSVLMKNLLFDLIIRHYVSEFDFNMMEGVDFNYVCCDLFKKIHDLGLDEVAPLRYHRFKNYFAVTSWGGIF